MCPTREAATIFWVRKQTFHRGDNAWSTSKRDDLSYLLADAGFIRSTIHDDVKCVHCLFDFNAKDEYPDYNLASGRHPMVIHAQAKISCPMVVSRLKKESEPFGMTALPDDSDEVKDQRQELWNLLEKFILTRQKACCVFDQDC